MLEDLNVPRPEHYSRGKALMIGNHNFMNQVNILSITWYVSAQILEVWPSTVQMIGYRETLLMLYCYYLRDENRSPISDIICQSKVPSSQSESVL